MSKTLFWYLLRDLLRIFLLASGTLAGIMSFGALLRPLTQHGLDASQVGKILSYFSPAMTTYSFPVAALFATTIVYGRLSADNELTACRACGISQWAMTWPAILLGLLVALVSLLFLSFLVPMFTLKVEKVIYSNIAQLVANKITRTHEITYGKTTIFAQAASVLPNEHGAQVVELVSPMVFTYANVEAPPDARDATDKSARMRVPSKVWMARRAVAYITQHEDKVTLEAVAEWGASFPRSVGGSQFIIQESQFGPVEMGSPIRENTKFMDVAQLKRLLAEPEQSRKLQGMVQQFVREEQRRTYFTEVARSIADPSLRSYRFIGKDEALIVSGTDLDVRSRGPELIIQPKSDPADTQRVLLISQREGEIVSQNKARQVRITVEPLERTDENPEPRMLVKAEQYDVIVEADQEPAARTQLPITVIVPMPKNLQQLEDYDVGYYLHSKTASPQEQKLLKLAHDKLIASIRAEMHARISFAVSCAILVFLGCSLGMISRSGNFLSAFAVSVIPALLCIALIVTGQHTCENNPKNTGLGLWLIWTGNIITAILAILLMNKLHRE
jgi:lipopolysaccharide export LptBFGC system permease protein LptF